MGKLDKLGELDIAGPRGILGILAHGVCEVDGAEMAPANIRTARWETGKNYRPQREFCQAPAPLVHALKRISQSLSCMSQAL